MTRLILFLFATVIVIGVLRAAMRIIFKGITDFFQAASPQAPQRAPGPSLPRTGSLKKDPVCGTFIAASTALQKTIKGQTYYFCSAACRDKFAG